MSQAGILGINPAAGSVTSITGNTGPAQTGAIHLITANSTPIFAGAAGTITLDFGLRNLFLGVVPPLAGGDENVAVGFSAGQSITTGLGNVIIGFDAGTNLTDGDSNVILGDSAMSASGPGTSENVAVGYASLLNLSGGTENTAVGFQSLISLTGGTSNVAIGFDAGSSYNALESDNIVILNSGQTGESGVIRIGTNSSQTTCFIAGIDGVDVGAVTTVVTELLDQLGTASLVAGTGISITPGPNSITFAATGAANPVTTLHTQDGNNVTATAGVINLSGGNNLTTTGTAGPNTATISLTGITQHSLQVGGAANALTQLGVASNGQLPIGSAGADPVLATLTAGTGISISNGAGSITISATGTTTLTVTSVNHAASPYTVLTTDEFLAVDVTAGVVSILLPNAPATGRVFYIKDSKGLAATSNITVTTVGGAVNIDGATSFVMNTAYESISVIFDGSAYEVF